MLIQIDEEGYRLLIEGKITLENGKNCCIIFGLFSIMVRILFFILTFGFVLQSFGAISFIKKPIEQTEQMSDDTPKAEEKQNTDGNKDQVKISGFDYFEIGFMLTLYGQFKNMQLYPSGVYTKPFLPPRF